jgi:hypothetical protein
VRLRQAILVSAGGLRFQAEANGFSFSAAAQNDGDVCAAHIVGDSVFETVDHRAPLLTQMIEWVLPAGVVLRPGTRTNFAGCCLSFAWSDRTVNLTTSFSYVAREC